jgi:transposase
MLYVGLDVHWKTSSIHILDENGKKVKARTIRGGWEKMLAVLAGLPRPWSICYEASCGYGALYDRLRRLSSQVAVAHPGRARLIFRSKRKNDRIDAEKLAKLLFLDEVPRVHVPAPAARAWRELIEFRCRLVEKRVRVKNALRALLRGQGIAMPRSLWSRKGLAWLAAVSLPNLSAEVRRELLLDELDSLERKVARVTAELDRQAARQPAVSLLRTIPGIGPRTAEAVAAYIDRPERFTKNRAIGAYFGLVPCQDASAGVNRLGHITREGPATVRKYLTEAAWRVTALDPVARAFFDRIADGKKDRRKIALVATAHWLLRCMLSMLQTGECWRHAA